MSAWDPERLKTLCDKTGVSQQDIAKATGIPYATFISYMRKSCPNADNLIRIADYFAVSTDFLLGRCSDEQNTAILENFPETFMKLRSEAYKRYLVHIKHAPRASKIIEYDAPWPYNLVEEITGEPITFPLSEKNAEALDVAIMTLYDRERSITLDYYKCGLSCRDIGKKYDITASRVQQIIKKALRKLKHPRFISAIVEGYHTSSDIKEAADKLEEREKVLKVHELEYMTALDILKSEQAAVDDIIKKLQCSNMTALSNKLTEIRSGIADRTDIMQNNIFLDEHISVLDLSCRSYNCLVHAGYDTIRSVYELIMYEPQVFDKDIRNLGDKSKAEIIRAMRNYIGDSIFDPKDSVIRKYMRKETETIE